MTTLADVTAGQVILFACQVASIDAAGYHMALYGPQRALAGTVIIGPDGSFTGGLAAAPASVPVTVVTGWVPISPGDVLCNDGNGETVVARAVRVGPDGTYTWSSSLTGGATYQAAGWSIVGHVSL